MYGHPAQKTFLSASVAIAACSFALSSTGELQLTPAGEFKARDGRPFEVDAWLLTDATAPALLDALKRQKNAIVIDYEHQTLLSDQNGKPAPAAGWFKGEDVVYRPGEGLFVTPEWTAAASAHIEACEYKYFSPVIRYNKKTGVVLDIVMGALTNHAAIDGMKEIEALAAAKFEINPIHKTAEEDSMHEKLKALLGLKQDASEDEVMAALKAVMKINQQAEEAIAAAKAETPSDTLAAMKAMQTELTALKADINESAVTDLVESALSDGRLLPAQEEWAKNLGKSNLASLKCFLDGVQPVAALKGAQTNGKQPDGVDQEALDETALAVCRQMGIDPEDFKKHMNQEVA